MKLTAPGPGSNEGEGLRSDEGEPGLGTQEGDRVRRGESFLALPVTRDRPDGPILSSTEAESP